MLKGTFDKKLGWVIEEVEDDEDEDELEVDCCKACGSDMYPHCMDSCPLFDD